MAHTTDSFFGSIVYRFFKTDDSYEATKADRRKYLEDSHKAAYYQRHVSRVARRKFARGNDLFYHNNPVMGPHSWGGATKTHLAYLEKKSAADFDEATH